MPLLVDQSGISLTFWSHYGTCVYIRPSPKYTQVGDELEMYIVLSRSHPQQALDPRLNATEVSTTASGEKVFVVRRPLKRD